jgi:hypothetical protein
MITMYAYRLWPYAKMCTYLTTSDSTRCLYYIYLTYFVRASYYETMWHYVVSFLKSFIRFISCTKSSPQKR